MFRLAYHDRVKGEFIPFNLPYLSLDALAQIAEAILKEQPLMVLATLDTTNKVVAVYRSGLDVNAEPKGH
jgi:hypothetical protein